jgi:hypothetical protein
VVRCCPHCCCCWFFCLFWFFLLLTWTNWGLEGVGEGDLEEREKWVLGLDEF